MVVEEQLGEGCFGEVHKGIVKGPIPNSRTMKHSICVTVALKFLKSKPVYVLIPLVILYHIEGLRTRVV